MKKILLISFIISSVARISAQNLSSVSQQEESITAERISNDSILIRWDIEYKSVKIYASISSDSLEQQENFIKEINKPDIHEYYFTGFDHNYRYNFLLVFIINNEETRKISVSESIVPLSGVFNFRDLGGYKTKDGKTIQWGLVYRSSSLSGMTNEDKQYLSELKLKSDIDFRTGGEKLSGPDVLPEGIKYYHMPIYHTYENPVGLRTFLPGGDIEQDWEDFYKMLIDKKAEKYGNFLKFLTDEEHIPVVFHCTAGKDRAGIAAVLFLATLGVPDETIIADYSISDKYFNVYMNHAREAFEKHKTVMRILNIKADDLAPFYHAKPEFIRSILKYIKDTYGSYQNYLINEAGIDNTVIQKLREIYLN